MDKNITYLAIVAAVSGFLFGFDTAVISGADKPIQTLWSLGDLFHGLVIMSSALWGTVLGALFGNIPLDKKGRKWTLIAIGILYLVSALGSGLAWDPYSFAFFRFIGGLGVGASSIAAPAYISEISPAKRRGTLVALYQFLIVFGILIAFLSNYLLDAAQLGESTWRWMIGMEALPALIYTVLVLSIPESPRWLALFKKDMDSAKAVLKSLDNTVDADQILNDLIAQNQGRLSENIYIKKYLKPVLLAFFLAFFNQASGINFIIYYAPRIFEETGLSASNSLIASMGIGIVNLIMTMVGVTLIDRLGRKQLLIIGSIGYIISLALIANAFFKESFSGVQWYIFLFIAAHAVGQGAVIWVYIAEIFPNNARANGQAFGTGVHWVGAAIITLLMPYVLKKYSGGPLFSFFCIMMVAQLIWVLWSVRETKGRSLEEIEREMIG
jgi:sugar porter (SP) family MFS transporter